MLATSSMPETAGARSPSDLDLLQGSWTSVAGPKDARLLIAGSRYAFELLGGDIYIGAFLLDTRPEPRHMDMRIEEGPPAYRGQLALCIYHLDGDILRWCPTRPGAGYRLNRFPSIDEERFLSLVFKRARHVRAH